MKLCTVLLAAGFALAAATPMLAQASTIDPVYYNNVSATHRYDVSPQFDVSDGATPGLSVSDGSTTASTSNHYGVPSVSSSVSSSTFLAGASASSNLTYFFTVNSNGGADATTAVNFTASGYVTATGGGGGNGFLTVGNPGTGSNFISVGMAGTPPIISLNQTFDLTIGAIYKVSMTTSVYVNNEGTATSYVDPYIHTLSPLYSISTFGPIGNAVAPIPAALPLFATGLGGLGLLGWRRRKAASERQTAAA
jgi:hypothetical protein